ncbi:MAG: MFS transporter, partial [Bacillota bacterium]|nr:MFS transporter [Bacillota bacterium]
MPMRLKLRSYYFFAVMGMIVVSQGSLMSPMLQKFDLSYASGGMLIAVNSVFYLISGLLAGVLIDRIEHRFVIFSGNVAFVLSMLTLTFAQNYLWLIIAWSLCGIGWGLLNSSVNSLINDQTGGNPSILSRMHMLYGVGAFVIPLVVRFFLGTRFGYLGATILLTAAAVGGLLLAFGVPGGAVARSPKEARKRLGSGWILFAAILFFYVGTEASFNNWMVSILTDAKGFQPQDAQTLLAVFWVSMIVGRLVTSLIPRIRSIGLVLLGLSIASLVSLAIFLFVAQPTLIVASIIL